MNRPLVVVSVGTDHHPFDRLLGWVADWARRTDVDVFAQYGTSRPPAAPVTGAPLLGHANLLERMSAAAAVVSHGGPATVADSRRVGIRPIVVPRRPDLGEHVDDHQVRFSRHLAALGDAIVAETEARLTAALDGALAEPSWLRLAPSETDAREAVDRFAELVDELQPRRRAYRRAHRRSRRLSA